MTSICQDYDESNDTSMEAISSLDSFNIMDNYSFWTLNFNNSLSNDVNQFNIEGRSILYLNINGMTSKKYFIDVMLEQLDHVYFFCVSEHWLGIGESLPIENFTLCSQYCRQNYQHGGVAIYARESAEFFQYDKLKHLCVERILEICSVQFHIPKLGNIILICLYRTPLVSIKDFLEALEKLLDFMADKKTVIVGDFNVDLLGDVGKANNFITLLNSYGFSTRVSDPTRVATSASSCLDNVVTNVHMFPSDVLIYETGLSDHMALVFQYDQERVSPHSTSVKRIFSKHDLIKYREFISGRNWVAFYCSDLSATDKFLMLHDFMLQGYQQCFPLKVLTHKKQNSWLTNGIRVSSNNKRDIFILVKRFPHPVLKQYYNRYSKILKNVVIAAKRLDTESKIITSNNKTKTIWQCVNSLTGRVAGTYDISLVNDHSEIIQDSTKIADIFLNQFNSIYNHGRSSMEFSMGFTPVSHNFFLLPVTEADVLKSIATLNNSSSSGPDEITANILKYCSDVLAEPIAHFINSSFSSGIFPAGLKLCKTIPVFKKGDRQDPGNYRPISLSNTLSKVIESIVKVRLENYCLKFNILNQAQHGFTVNKSTESALYELLSEIYANCNRDLLTAVIICDLSKAFDLVDHRLLLQKLEGYGVRGLSLEWFRSFLSDRQQYVVVGGSKSEQRSVTAGVPQGSILGPLLFNLFVNDLPLCTGAKVVMYADDTTAIISATSIDELMIRANNVLSELSSWFKANHLVLNIEKTNVMLFKCTFLNDFSLSINDQPLQTVKSSKILGLMLDDELKFNNHVDNLLSKLSSATFALRSLRYSVSMAVLIMAYRAFFESLLRYCIQFYGASTRLPDVLLVQKRAIRVMFRLSHHESCRNYFRDNKLLTVVSMYIQSLLFHVFKHLNTYERNQDVHAYYTRNRNDIRIDTPSNARFAKSAMYRSRILFNKLPIHIRELNNIRQFKTAINGYLIDGSFYSVEEFENYLSSL